MSDFFLIATFMAFMNVDSVRSSSHCYLWRLKGWVVESLKEDTYWVHTVIGLVYIYDQRSKARFKVKVE